MIIRDSKLLCDLDENIVRNYTLDNLVFFDIEATGFNVKKDWVFALSFILKLAVDWIVMARANRFLGQGSFVFPVFSAVVYPIFSSVVAVLAARGKYAWKGRKFIPSAK